MRRLDTAAVALALCALVAPVWAQSVSPGNARVDSTDARRFAALFQAHDGAPPANVLQHEYLDRAGAGLQMLLDNDMIDSAEDLAAYVARNKEKYRRGIDVCLPIAERAEHELRAIYGELHRLLPDRPLPEIQVAFGRGNVGGTAQAGIQVLGLEVICEEGDTPQAIGAILRRFFAHETVHTWQNVTNDQLLADPLGYSALKEGAADYIAFVVTGEEPVPARDRWAREREAWLWKQFQSDRARMRELARGKTLDALPEEALNLGFRWISNYGKAPEGWPHEAGYWVGRRIVAAYVERAVDKQAALNAVLALEDAETIIVESKYGAAF
jgi:hypothetical protein